MLYIKLIILGLIFSAGFGLSHKLDSAEIQRLESSIIEQNIKAAAVLAVRTADVAAAEAKAETAALNLDKSYESAINTANAYYDLRTADRLRDPGRQRSGSPVPKSDSPGNTQTETANPELSTELTRFLQVKFYSADLVAAYANACYTFVVEQNCGIKN